MSELGKEKQRKSLKEIIKMRSFWKKVISIVCWVLIGAVFSVGLCQRIDQKTNYTFLKHHTAVIISNSMSYSNEVNTYLPDNVEHIYKGDIVKTSPYSSFDDLKEQDVILYFAENGDLVCHRVIVKYVTTDGNYVLTRGDANNRDDAPVKFDLVRGKVTRIEHKTGNIILFLRSPYFLFGVCGVCFFVLLGFLISVICSKDDKDKGDKQSKKHNKRNRLIKKADFKKENNSKKIVLVHFGKPFLIFALCQLFLFVFSFSDATAIHIKGLNSVNFSIGSSVNTTHSICIYDGSGNFVRREALIENSQESKELMITGLSLQKDYQIVAESPSGSSYGGSYSHNIAVGISIESGLLKTVSGVDRYIATQTGTYDFYFKFSNSDHDVSHYTSAYVNVNEVTVLYIQNKKSDDWAGIRYWGDDVINSPSDYYYANDTVTQWDGKNTFRYYVPSHATGFKVRNGWYESCDLSLTIVQNNNTHAIWFDNNNGGYNGWAP